MRSDIILSVKSHHLTDSMEHNVQSEYKLLKVSQTSIDIIDVYQPPYESGYKLRARILTS